MKLKTILLCAALSCVALIPAQAQNNIWSYTALGAAPASADKLFLYDDSASASKTITIANLFTSPTFVTPTLGVATATSLNGLTITSSTGTLTITNSKTLAVSNTLTFTGTDASSVAFGTGGTVTYTANNLSVFAATTSAQLAGVLSNESGTGVAVFNDTPTLITPVLGVATATTINKVTITAPATGATLTLSDGSSLITSGGHSITLTSTGATNVTLPTTGTLSTLAGSETLTNKAISLTSNTFTATSAQLITAVTNETGSGLLVFGTAPTLTSPVVNTPTLKQLTEVVTASNTIAASETGTVFILSSATEFPSELPAPAAGLNFVFIVGAAPSGASYTITTTSSSNVIKGKQISVAGDAGDTGSADDTITFVDGEAVAGDMVEVWSDGTSWFARATSAVAAGVTFTQAD